MLPSVCKKMVNGSALAPGNVYFLHTELRGVGFLDTVENYTSLIDQDAAAVGGNVPAKATQVPTGAK